MLKVQDKISYTIYKKIYSLDNLFLNRDPLKRAKLKSFTKNSKINFQSNPSTQYRSIHLNDEKTFPSKNLINIKTSSKLNSDVSTLL